MNATRTLSGRARSTRGLSTHGSSICTTLYRTAAGVALTIIALLGTGAAQAEQMQRLGPYEAHYVVVQTTFFSEAVAEQYNIVRGRDRSLVNLSFLDAGNTPVPVTLEGTTSNLLSQIRELEFREVREGPAIYYLSELKASNQDTLRFRINVTTPDGVTRELRFQHQIFWDGR